VRLVAGIAASIQVELLRWKEEKAQHGGAFPRRNTNKKLNYICALVDAASVFGRFVA
jgi:hypothetical protein